jgi:hypothetical protein
MKWLKKTWQWLNGKKTSIGMAVMLAAQGIQVFAPNLMTPGQIDFIQNTGALIGGFGLMHKGAKTTPVKRLTDTLTKVKKK